MASEIIHFLLSTARDEKSVLRVHPDRRSRPVTVIREGRRRVLVALRQSEPSLDPEQAVRPAARRRRNALRMGDSAARDHPVQCARTDDSIGPGAGPAMDVAAAEAGHGGETDLRMRPDIDTLARQTCGGAGLVEDPAWRDRPAIRCRHGASNLEAAEIPCTETDERLGRVDAHLIAATRLQSLLPLMASYSRSGSAAHDRCQRPVNKRDSPFGPLRPARPRSRGHIARLPAMRSCRTPRW